MKSKTLDHLGLVAAMCEQVGLEEMIDTLIPPDSRAALSTGETVKLMVINGLGFTSRPLYLEEQFFHTKPIERLLGRELESSHISDDRLGRALDRLYETGCDHIFSIIASKAAIKFNIDPRFRHLDTTSMHVHGEYEDGFGLVEFGYSKDKRPDLKQFMVSLMSSQDGDVPLLAKIIPGNTSDQTHFRRVLSELKEHIATSDTTTYYVADSSFYHEKNISQLSARTKWITRVPHSITLAKNALQIPLESMGSLQDGYATHSILQTYGGVDQRWVVVYSQEAYERERKTLGKKIAKEGKALLSVLKNLSTKKFGCEKDALTAVKSLQKKFLYHSVSTEVSLHRTYSGKGRPKKGEKGRLHYCVQTTVNLDEAQKEQALQSKGKFIIATNELDTSELSENALLANYKSQQSVERGFRFLKDSRFLTSSVFLKNEERIVALGMIMCLCLLVYMLTQRMLRQQLTTQQKSFSNQLGKSVSNPTVRWVYMVFEGIHVLYQNTSSPIVLNLSEPHDFILELLGERYWKKYQ